MEAAAGPSGENMKKKPMLDQVCEAIKALGKPRIGVSAVAMKKHILDTYEESKHARMEVQFKKAILMGVESGLLVRPAKCKNSVGATGSFLLNKEKLKTMIDKPQKNPDDKLKKTKKLYKSEDGKVVQKPIKPKAKKPNKKQEDEKKIDGHSEDFFHSTPKNSDSEVEQKPAKPRAMKKTVKSTKKDEALATKKHASDSELSEDKQNSDSEVEQKPAKPRALKKTVKSTKKDEALATKKHVSDSELSDVKQKAVKRKNLKDKSKNTAKNNKPGTSDSLKETEIESEVNNEKKKTKRVLKSHNSDSVLM